jgi:hypothetical protein
MIKVFLAALSIGAVFVAGTAVAQAAPPANDSFAAAAPLAVGQEISSANLEATAEAGEPNPAGGAKVSDCAEIDEAPRCATSVWYTFEPPPGQYTIETCDFGTDLNSVLGVYTGSGIGSAVEIAANNDESSLVFCPGGYYGQGSRVSFTAAGGTAYHVDVTGYNGEQGSFYLRAYAGSAPQPRPAPDTGIARLENSFAYATATGGFGSGVTSGPRHSASFLLEADTEGATFECSLDGAAFAACANPISYDGLAPGSSHVFAARAVSGGSPDPTPAVERFTIDLTPPDTTLSSGPEGETGSQEAEWTAAGSERNQFYESSGFLCRLDGQPARPCGASQQYASLCQGPHTFASAAWDRAANVDPSPASAEIDVTTGPACAAPTVGEPAAVGIEPTRANIEFAVDSMGAGASLHVDYGPTAAYGMTLEKNNLESLEPNATGLRVATLRFLAPDTLYHYRVTVSSPFGTVSTADQTLTTSPLTGAETLPAVQAGTPSASEHAALIPVTIDTGGVYTNYFMRIAAGGPVTAASGKIGGRTEIEAGLTGPQAGRLEVVDLEPSTTYHFRVGAEHGGSDSNEVLGPEGTFTTPPLPTPPESTPPGSTPAASTPSTAAPSPTAKPHFRLRKGAIAIGKLRRSSKRLLVRVRDLPADTATSLELDAGKGHLKARKVASAGGLAKFDLKLPAKVRAALENEKVETVAIRIVASPPGDTSSSVTLKPELKSP